MNAANRIAYIDVMRGLAILFVIYHHIMVFVLGKWPADSVIMSVVHLVMMPIFFFISGFLLHKSVNGCFTSNTFREKAIKRIVVQLYPTVVFFLLFISFKGLGLRDSIYAGGKAGYWFTFSAIEYFFLMAPVLLFLSSKGIVPKWGQGLTVSIYGALIISFFYLICAGKQELRGLLEYQPVIRFFPFYIMGIVSSLYSQAFFKMASSRIWAFFCLCIFLAIYNGLIPLRNEIIEQTAGFFELFVIFFIFTKLYELRYIAACRLSQWMQKLGGLTLEIYLLHYFMIEALKGIVNTKWLVSLLNTVWEFPVFMGMSLIIALCCIAFTMLLDKLGLKKFIFPKSANFSLKLPHFGLLKRNA